MGIFDAIKKTKKKAEGYIQEYEKGQEESRRKRFENLNKKAKLLRAEVKVKKLEASIDRLERKKQGRVRDIPIMDIGFGEPPRKRKKGRRDDYDDYGGYGLI